MSERFTGTVQAQTKMAILIDFVDQECWIPKSQIEDSNPPYEDIHTGQTIEVEIPDWLAIEKELV